MDQKSVVFQISGTVNPVNMDTEGAIKVSVLTGFPLSLPQRGGEAGEKEKESARPSYPARFPFFRLLLFLYRDTQREPLGRREGFPY